MRKLAIFSTSTPMRSPLPRVRIDGVEVGCAVLSSTAPRPRLTHPGEVLVRVRSFSCNYRDRTLARTMGSISSTSHLSIGSEFLGEIVEADPAATGFAPGDRVLPDQHYTAGQPTEGVAEGVATNRASLEYLVFPAAKLRPAPRSMPDEVGGAFSLNAQTAFGMVRRAQIRPNGRVLVTSARSNTSLFVLQALRGRPDVTVVATTTSSAFRDAIERAGADVVAVTPRGSVGGFLSAIREHGPYDAVLDPFFDLHVHAAIRALVPFGRYVTCGLAAQNPGSGSVPEAPASARDDLLTTAIVNNVELVGNCIGLSSDLDDAVAAVEAGRFEVPIDSVFSDPEAAPFLDRTFNDSGRFGKVSFLYS